MSLQLPVQAIDFLMYDITTYSYLEQFPFNPALTLFILVGLFIAFNALYFIPTIVAFHRGHRNRWVIFAINFLLGYTGIVWILLLIWALDKFDDPLP